MTICFFCISDTFFTPVHQLTVCIAQTSTFVEYGSRVRGGALSGQLSVLDPIHGKTTEMASNPNLVFDSESRTHQLANGSLLHFHR